MKLVWSMSNLNEKIASIVSPSYKQCNYLQPTRKKLKESSQQWQVLPTRAASPPSPLWIISSDWLLLTDRVTISHVIDISTAKDDTGGFHLKSYLITKKYQDHNLTKDEYGDNHIKKDLHGCWRIWRISLNAIIWPCNYLPTWQLPNESMHPLSANM